MTKKTVFFLLKTAVSGTFLYLVLRKAGFLEVTALLKTIPPFLFLMCIAITVFSMFLGSMRWKLFLSGKFPLGKLFSFYLIGTFFNIVMPGIVGGDAVKAYYVNKGEKDLPRTLASLFLDRFSGYLSQVLMCITAYPVVYPLLKGTQVNALFPTMIALFLIITFVLFKTTLLGKFRYTEKFHGYIMGYARDRRALLLSLTLSLAIQTCYVTSIFILARAMGWDGGISLVFAFFPVIAMLSSIPVSISGLGIREASFVILFGAVGWTAESAVTLSFAWFLTLVFTGMIGLVEFTRAGPGRVVTTGSTSLKTG